MLELPRPEPACWIAQFERPQEIACLLEVDADGEDLVDQIFHAHNAVFSQVVLDELIVGKWDSLFVDFAVATLVDKFANRLDGREAIGDIGFNNLEHFRRGFSQANKDAIIDLEEA